jgi:tRNA 2-thiouridine synthesizing protein B
MLHIVNKSHAARSSLATCLRLAQDGCALLLTEDGVLSAARGSAQASGIAEAARRLKVYVLQPDAQARGVADRLIEGVTPVDYPGFVKLVGEHPTNQSWL